MPDEFAFVPPSITPLKVTDAQWAAHPDLAKAYSHAIKAVEDTTREAQTIMADRNLSAEGKRTAFTKNVLPRIKATQEHLAGLDQFQASVEAEGARLLAEATDPPHATPIQRHERLSLGEAFGRMSHEEKKSYLDRAMVGKDMQLADALVSVHRLVTGVAEATQERLREILVESRLDPKMLEKVAAQAELVRGVRTTVAQARTALEGPADRDVLRKASVATMRRADLRTDKERSDYIDRYGLAAFKALPQ